MHTYIHTYIHAYIHTSIHTYIHTYIHLYIYTCVHIHTSCLYIYIYIYIYIHMSFCKLASCLETDLLSRNTQPLLHHPSTKPSARSPTQAGDRHTLRPDEHPRTTKAVAADATASHICSRQPRPRALCTAREPEEKRRAPGRPRNRMSTQDYVVLHINLSLLRLAVGVHTPATATEDSPTCRSTVFSYLPLGTEKFPKPGDHTAVPFRRAGVVVLYPHSFSSYGH